MVTFQGVEKILRTVSNHTKDKIVFFLCSQNQSLAAIDFVDAPCINGKL
jgi:hypothetical protein